MPQLNHQLSAWDGKSKSEIEAVFKAHQSAPSFLPSLIKALSQPETQDAASWLIKHGLEQKTFVLDAAAQTKIVSALPALQTWPSRLHILQILETFNMPQKPAPTIELFLREGMTDENKFVRAWSYSGFHWLAKHNECLRGEALAILQQALEEETAASVLARVRKKLAEGF